MRDVFYGNTYNGYDLNETRKNDRGFNLKILQALESLMNYVTWRHGRVYFIRFDLTYPAGSVGKYPNDNELLKRFIEALTLYYKRQKHDPKYLWVRELSSTGQDHYHFVFILDSNLIQEAYGPFLDKVTDLWQRQLVIENGDGLVELCKKFGNGGVKIIKSSDDFHQVFKKCFKRASYLAKCYSKGESPAYVNEFGCSRIPKEYLS